MRTIQIMLYLVVNSKCESITFLGDTHILLLVALYRLNYAQIIRINPNLISYSKGAAHVFAESVSYNAIT